MLEVVAAHRPQAETQRRRRRALDRLGSEDLEPGVGSAPERRRLGGSGGRGAIARDLGHPARSRSSSKNPAIAASGPAPPEIPSHLARISPTSR